MITKEYIRQLAADAGFSAACFCAPSACDGAPPNTKSLLLLLMHYTPCDGLVDAFYPAKQRAYHAVRALIERIENLGIYAENLGNLRLKPIATERAGLARGLNTINYHEAFGSRFCMELIGMDAEFAADLKYFDQCTMECSACGRCMHACPGGAITKDGFIKENCIRFYMMSGKPVPEHLREYAGSASYGIIGCDVCQRVCPQNARVEDTRGENAAFSLEELLICSNDTLQQFGEMYGRNYANRNRIIAQAVLAAANSGDARYLPQIEALTASPSPLVRDHAAWAMKKMTNLLKIY